MSLIDPETTVAPCLENSDDINLSISELDGRSLRADLRVSTDTGNGFERTASGLYVPARPLKIAAGPFPFGDEPDIPDGLQVLMRLTSNVEWLFSWSVEDSQWKFIGGPPLDSRVSAAQNRPAGAGTYDDLATAGPSVDLPYVGQFNILYGARMVAGGVGNAWVSVKFSSSAADDADGMTWGQTFGSSESRLIVGTNNNLGQQAIMKYKNLDGSDPATFDNRWLLLWPRN